MDIIGKKFSKLLVLEKTDERDKWNNILYKCQCECGNITYSTSSILKGNHKKSCGCLMKETRKNLKHEIKDFTGQRFGKLVAIERLKDYEKKDDTYYLCKCDCGNEKIVRRTHLRSGGTRSCGCLVKEVLKKYNEIIIEGDVAKIRLGETNQFTIIDTEDLEKVKPYYWTISKYGYVVSGIRKKREFISLRLHRLILGEIPKDKEVDHIDQNKLNNKKSNLRIVTSMENNNNKRKCKVRSSTGVKYIFYDKRTNFYVSYYTRYKKFYYVGCCKNLEEMKQRLIESFKQNNFTDLIEEMQFNESLQKLPQNS